MKGQCTASNGKINRGKPPLRVGEKILQGISPVCGSLIVHDDGKHTYAASSCTYYCRTRVYYNEYLYIYIYYTTRIPRTLLHEPRAAATATGPSCHSPFPSPRIRTRPAQIDKNTLSPFCALSRGVLFRVPGEGVYRVWGRRYAVHAGQ